MTWIHGVGLEPNVPITPPDNQPSNQDAVLAMGVQVIQNQLANPTATFPTPPTPPPPSPSPSPAAVTDQSVLELSLAAPLAFG
jgi:hypothetical protein